MADSTEEGAKHTPTLSELYDHREHSDETRNLASHADLESEVTKHANFLKNMNPIVTPGWKPVLK